MAAITVKPREFLVVLYSKSDENALLALNKLGERTKGDLATFATVDCGDNGESSVDPKSIVFRDGLAHQVLLIDWLAKNLATLETVRLVALVASGQDAQTLLTIDSSMRRLVSVFSTMKVNLLVKEFRVACPTYSSEIPKEPFFAQSAHAHLVVIARDSSSHKAIARPIEISSNDDYTSHIAIEISTIFGMWKEISRPIIDDLEAFHTGVPEVLVRFVSSHVNLLDCPPLPISKLMSQDGELPLPHKFFSVPDANQAAEKFSVLIYPPELRFVPTEPPLGPLVTVDGKKFKKRYLKELFIAFVNMPFALLRGVQDHLNAMSGAALQEAVGGSKSSIEIMYPGRNVDRGEAAITREQVDQMIHLIADRADRPVISTIGEQAWIQIIEKVFAVADGGDVASDERRIFSDDKFLLTRQSSLSPEVDDLSTLLRELYEGVAADVVAETPVADIAADVVVETPVADVAADVVVETPVADVAASEELPVEILAVGEVIVEIEHVAPELPSRADLLGKITRIMLEEGSSARMRSEQMVGYLRELPTKFAASDVGTIANAVKFAVALGISLVYLGFGSLTRLRNVANFEFLGDKSKSLVWVLATTLIIFAAVAGVLIKNNQKWQGKVITATTILVVIMAVEFVFWENIWKFVLKVDRFRGGPLAAALLLLVAVVVVAISIVKNRASDNKVRKQFAGVLLATTWIYGVVGATAAWGDNRSVWWRDQKPWSEATRHNVLKVSIAAGLALLIVSGLVVAFSIVRERYKLEELSRYLVWAVDELETSTDAEKRLRLAASQWTGTAAVLARLLRYPLGKGILEKGYTSFEHISTLQALKFDQQQLILTKRGEQGLTARLRQLFIAKGWLSRQYRQMISKFQTDLAFEQGLSLDDTRGTRPEACPAAPSFMEIVNGEARGSRWSFMKNVFDNQYDSVLLQTTSEVQLEDAYSTIVDDPESHSVGEMGLIASNYFDRLVPHELVRIPNGLVTALFSGNDSRQIMKPYVWWPEELLPKPHSKQSITFRESKVLSPEKLTDPIRLLGSCVLLSEAFVLTDVGPGEGLFNRQNQPLGNPPEPEPVRRDI